MIELRNVSKYYHDNGNVVKALEDISVTFKRGEFVVVTGESGSGKSTFLNVVSGLDRYEAGEMFIDGKETSHFSGADFEHYRRETIGFVFQSYNIIDAYTVYQNIDVALMISGMGKLERRRRVKEILDRVGLKKQRNQRASKLSGGEKQRVAIARALAKDAPVIVADEPTGNLDKNTGKKILDLLKELSVEKLVLLVSHSQKIAEEYATRHLRLFDGKIIEDKTIKSSRTHESVKTEKSPLDEISPLTLFSIAMKNIVAMPKKSLFVLFASLFIVFVFAMTYGSYVRQTHASAMEFHPHFRNTTESRIVVTRRDGEAFTDDELETFRAESLIRAVAPYDAFFDEELRIIPSDGVTAPEIDEWHMDAARIQHASALTPRDLSAGRLPENEHEIVATEPYAVGEFLAVPSDPTFFGGFHGPRDTPTDDIGDFMHFEIVGIAAETPATYQRHIHFHDDFFPSDFARLKAFIPHHPPSLEIDDFGTVKLEHYFLHFDDDIDKGELVVSEHIKTGYFAGVPDEDFVGNPMRFFIENDFTDEIHESTVEVREITTGDRSRGVAMNTETLTDLFDEIGRHQVGLVVRDSHDAQQVMDTLDGETYNYVYPAAYTSEVDAILGTVVRIFQGGFSFLLLLVLYFLSYIALKNVMQARTKDFVILRSLGARQKDIHRLNVAETASTMVIALGLVFGFLVLNRFVRTPIPDYLHFFNVGNYLVMILVMLVLSVLLAARFNSRLYRDTVTTAFREAGDVA